MDKIIVYNCIHINQMFFIFCRRLSLLDIERITNPKSIINKVVFDLDSLLLPTPSTDKSSPSNSSGEVYLTSSSSASNNQSTSDQITPTYTSATSGINSNSTNVNMASYAKPVISSTTNSVSTTDRAGAYSSDTTQSVIGNAASCSNTTATNNCCYREIPTLSHTITASSSGNTNHLELDDELLCTSLKDLAMLQEVYSSDDDMEVSCEQALTSDSSSEQVREPNYSATSTSNSGKMNSCSHLEFESRFESGNLRKAIQVRGFSLT